MKRKMIYEEMVDIFTEIPNGYAAQIRRFTNLSCNDPSIPLQLIHSFLLNAQFDPHAEKNLERYRNLPEFLVLEDLISSSQLKEVVEVGSNPASLRFVAEFNIDQRVEFSQYLASRTGAIE